MRMCELPLAGIDAAILVGGLGTRLRGVVSDVPKPLAPVLGRPFLFYILDMLALRGARSATLCCGYKAEMVSAAVGSEWLGMPVGYSVEPGPMGTGGALGLAREHLRSDPVLLLNGDSWLEPDWLELREAAAGDGIDACLSLVNVVDSSRFGAVRLNGNRVVAFEGSSGTGCPGPINGGACLISRRVLASLPPSPCSLEADVFPVLAAEGRLAGLVSGSPFLDIGIPGSYAMAADFMTVLGIAPHSMFPDFPLMSDARPKLGTCAVVLDGHGRVLLEQRSDCGWWCLPGGRLDAGETLAQGAVREVREETGLEIEITGFLGVFSDPRRRTVRYPDNGDLRQLVDAVVVGRPAGGEPAKSSESLDVRWFAPASIPLHTVPPVIEILRLALVGHSRGVLR